MYGAIPPLSHVFMAWCFVKHRDNITLTVTVGAVALCFKKFTGNKNYLAYQFKKFLNVWRLNTIRIPKSLQVGVNMGHINVCISSQ
jgi:hypothetical protein